MLIQFKRDFYDRLFNPPTYYDAHIVAFAIYELMKRGLDIPASCWR